MKPLLVGESNPYGSDPRYALWCEPENSAGGRLCRLILGLTRKDERGRDVADQKTYFRAFDRVNLCAGKWDAGEARESALRIGRKMYVEDMSAMSSGNWPTPPYRIVLLGAKVSAAFGGLEFNPFTISRASGRIYVVLPHPSGRCRAWNEPGAFERARAVLREAGVLPVPAR